MNYITTWIASNIQLRLQTLGHAPYSSNLELNVLILKSSLHNAYLAAQVQKLKKRTLGRVYTVQVSDWFYKQKSHIVKILWL